MDLSQIQPCCAAVVGLLAAAIALASVGVLSHVRARYAARRVLARDVGNPVFDDLVRRLASGELKAGEWQTLRGMIAERVGSLPRCQAGRVTRAIDGMSGKTYAAGILPGL